MKKLHQRITQITVLPAGEPIFSEMATVITIQDEAAGEYITLQRLTGSEGDPQKASIDPKEWPSIRDAIDRMMGEISDWEEITNDTKE